MAQRTQEVEDVTLDCRRRDPKVRVREDVAGCRKHAHILARRTYLYNRARPSGLASRCHAAPTETFMDDATRSELRVRYSETDQMGVVYHTNYLVWCEIGRTDFIRSSGLTYAELERRGVLLAVAEASIRYHAAARYDDLIAVHTMLAAVRSRAVTFDYLITHATTGDRLATARTVLVSLDTQGRPTTLPADFRERLDRSRPRSADPRS